MATEKKITKKDNFIAIVNILEAAGHTDLADVIKHEIELLENKAAKAKATAAKKKTDGDALTAAVEAALTDELTTIADITAKVEFDDEVTVSKVQYRLNQLEKNGKARKEQITVGGDGAKRKVMAFALPVDADVDED
jgi:DNA-binding protein H-NS